MTWYRTWLVWGIFAQSGQAVFDFRAAEQAHNIRGEFEWGAFLFTLMAVGFGLCTYSLPKPLTLCYIRHAWLYSDKNNHKEPRWTFFRRCERCGRKEGLDRFGYGGPVWRRYEWEDA